MYVFVWPAHDFFAAGIKQAFLLISEKSAERLVMQYPLNIPYYSNDSIDFI